MIAIGYAISTGGDWGDSTLESSSSATFGPMPVSFPAGSFEITIVNFLAFLYIQVHTGRI